MIFENLSHEEKKNATIRYLQSLIERLDGAKVMSTEVSEEKEIQDIPLDFYVTHSDNGYRTVIIKINFWKLPK